jgi:TatD DNase family protein
MPCEKGRALVARMPPERVLTESDGPFAQIDGVALLPWQVESAVSSVAGIWSVSYEKTNEAILANLKELLVDFESSGSRDLT